MLEEKALLKEDFLASRVTLKNDSKEMKELDIVVWTAQQCSDSDSEVDTQIIDAVGSGIVFKKRLVKPRRRPYPAHVILALEGKESHNVSFSERTGNLPNFRLTPFYEKLERDGLIERIDTNGINREGLLYIGLHRKVKLAPGSETTFNCGLGAAPGPQLRRRPPGGHGTRGARRPATGGGEYRGRGDAAGVRRVHPPRGDRHVERRGAVLGLPVARLPLRCRRRGPRRPRDVRPEIRYRFAIVTGLPSPPHVVSL